MTWRQISDAGCWVLDTGKPADIKKVKIPFALRLAP